MMNKLKYDILETNIAIEKYGINFYEQKGMTCGGGLEVYILRDGDIPVAWYLFTVEIDDLTDLDYIVTETGIYVKPGYRGRGIGNYLIERLVRYLDRRLGRGNYTFESTVVTRKGRAICQYRNSLTSNPDGHYTHIIKKLVPTY